MLQNKVAVVTGATRGAGKGVALALGDAGATVYVTGRTSRAGPAVAAPLIGTNTAAPGCVEDTAEEVTRRGGTGIPVLCDHTNVDQVAALFNRVRQEQHGRLDVLVNAAWGGNELDVTQTPPFWELPLQDHWRNMFDAGVSAALTASQQAAAIMVEQQQGLIVNVTFWDDDKYTGHMMYDLAKAALNRMAFGMAHDLVPHKVAVLAVTPGWMRTERVLAQFGCSTDTKHMYSTSQTLSHTNTASTAAAAGKPTLAAGNTECSEDALLGTAAQGSKTWTDVPELSDTESPLYLGRAIVALAADPAGALSASKAGSVVCVSDLAAKYDFTDVDGRQPARFRL